MIKPCLPHLDVELMNVIIEITEALRGSGLGQG